jgi:hypothetical protein
VAVSDDDIEIGEVCWACIEAGPERMQARLDARAKIARAIADEEERIAPRAWTTSRPWTNYSSRRVSTPAGSSGRPSLRPGPMRGALSSESRSESPFLVRWSWLGRTGGMGRTDVDRLHPKSLDWLP